MIQKRQTVEQEKYIDEAATTNLGMTLCTPSEIAAITHPEKFPTI